MFSAKIRPDQVEPSRRRLLTLGLVTATGSVTLFGQKAAAAENRNILVQLTNKTTGPLSLTSVQLPWGKWVRNPPARIESGAYIEIQAEGASGSATGTEGAFTYAFADNETFFTYRFDIPYSSANSGGVTLSGKSMSQYAIDAYPFPTSGNAIVHAVTVRNA